MPPASGASRQPSRPPNAPSPRPPSPRSGWHAAEPASPRRESRRLGGSVPRGARRRAPPSPRADRGGASSLLTLYFLRGLLDQPHQLASEQLVEEGRDVADQGVRIGIVALGKRLAEIAHAARLRQQPPDFAADTIEPEIGARALAQHDDFAVHFRGNRFIFLDDHAIEADGHARAHSDVCRSSSMISPAVAGSRAESASRRSRTRSIADASRMQSRKWASRRFAASRYSTR